MTMNVYIADELANKVYHLTKALNQTNKIVERLEEENTALKEFLEKIEHANLVVVEQ